MEEVHIWQMICISADRDYERELCVGNCMDVIPDPHKLDRGWISEEQGIIYWPVTLYVVSI